MEEARSLGPGNLDRLVPPSLTGLNRLVLLLPCTPLALPGVNLPGDKFPPVRMGDIDRSPALDRAIIPSLGEFTREPSREPPSSLLLPISGRGVRKDL